MKLSALTTALVVLVVGFDQIIVKVSARKRNSRASDFEVSSISTTTTSTQHYSLFDEPDDADTAETVKSNVPAPTPFNPPIQNTGFLNENQKATKGELRHYTMPISEGSTISCFTSGNNGDANLYVRFGSEISNPPDESSPDIECFTDLTNSNGICTTGPAPRGGTIAYAGVHAYQSYSDLVVVCRENPPRSMKPTMMPTMNSRPTTIQPLTVDVYGVGVITDQAAAQGELHHYTIPVREGSSITCAITGSNGDADLFVRFGSAPNPSSSSDNQCFHDLTGSNGMCTTGPAPRGGTVAYAGVFAHESYMGLTVMCTDNSRRSSSTTTSSTITSSTTTTKAKSMKPVGVGTKSGKKK